MTKIEGLITVESALEATATLNWLDTVIAAKGVTVFAKINHAGGASGVGMDLRPTTVLILGTALTGTPLMQMDQRMGLDLPLRLLVWTDEVNRTFITYNDPFWIAARFGLFAPQLGAMKGLLDALAEGPPHRS